MVRQWVIRFGGLVAVIIFGSAFFVSRAFVYDTNIAHPGLTKMAAETYNAAGNGHKLTAEEIGLLAQGAIDEDYPFRWMNHFYDPINNRGLKGSYDTAKTWAKNAQNQASFSLGDHSWQRAIYEYQQGNKKEAFLALGHILHLLEDMTVPAHTRNDAHPNGDPYEQWVKNNFQAVSGQPIYFDSLEKYFDYLANYSNRNFYSGDTILSNKFVFPDLRKSKELNSYLYDEFGLFRLIKIEEVALSNKKIYVIDTKVNEDYFSLLAPKAVGAGAGVIKLFFDEAAKEKVAVPTSLQTNLWGDLQQPAGRLVTFLEDTMNGVKKIISQPGIVSGYIGFASDLFGSGVALAQDLNNMPVVKTAASFLPETKLVNQAAQVILPMAASVPIASSPSPMMAKAPLVSNKASSAPLPSVASIGMTNEDSSAPLLAVAPLGMTEKAAPVESKLIIKITI